ncbi:FprA family A-type flavoprotein [Proteiniclasticum sp. SCR006]|uniref:FprA family A-type flavoprotein n=1 Tax=Proteiniclasticum aestuarii TaxID=2817862 RepID=A0A939HBG8_9CLOT|nr:FprA family A-type flavoprotein [Proteiniclasticum aestuarii]MBO1264263.1 FprA family A-type flavoprotein [Proteiniclasticum aestuarii]
MREIADKVYWAGKVDDRKVPFHRLILEKGTSYNAYLIKDEKTALIDTVDMLYGKEFVDSLGSEMDLLALDYIIVNHTEPDHSGALGALARKAKNARIVCTAYAVYELMEMYKIDKERFLVVRTGDEISLGEKTLVFHETPFLHTEETMVTYLKEEKILFPCDIFSTHVADNDALSVSELEDADSILEDFKVYYKLIMDPHRRYVLPMIDVVKKLDIEMIAPSHGYILDQNVEKYIGIYEENALESKENVKALILFNTMSGNTKKMARMLENELLEHGFEVESTNTEKAELEEVLTKIQYADGVLFGTSTKYADIPGNLEAILKELKELEVEGKPAAAFGSYGWSGEAVEVVQDYLTGAGMKALRSSDVIKSTGMSNVEFPLRVRFNPENSTKEIKLAASVFADAIRF